jgi:hypothetical protein
MNKLLAVFILASLCGAAVSQTVNDAIMDAGCNTGVLAGLARQLVGELNCLEENLFADIGYLADNLALGPAVKVVPFLQNPAADALASALNSKPDLKMKINSALRTLPQQLMLYRWYQMGKCGIPLAGKPGSSNHNGGLSIDIDNAAGWRSTLESNGWKYFGSSDPVHFDYVAGGEDIRKSSVLAFQKLWNRNNSTAPLDEDGMYGPRVENAMLNSPINGFPLGC